MRATSLLFIGRRGRALSTDDVSRRGIRLMGESAGLDLSWRNIYGNSLVHDLAKNDSDARSFPAGQNRHEGWPWVKDSISYLYDIVFGYLRISKL